MKLFILGNGFDRAHDLPTSYCQFRSWLIQQYNVNVDEEIELPDYKTNYKRLEDYNEEQFASFFVRLIDEADSNSETEDKWCCFEEDLAKLRWELGLHSEDMVYDDDGHVDLIRTENNLTIRAQTCGESNHILRILFSNWISYINSIISRNINAARPFFSNIFDVNGKYLTFNYTNTLEELYGIKDVCHIHGDISRWEELVFGHCDPGYPEKKYEDYEYGAYCIFRKIYESYIKDTQKLIKKYAGFFESIKEVDEIYLYGLSFGEVDLPYFRYIFDNCQKLCNIYLNVYNPAEFDKNVAKLKSCGAKCTINKW